MPGNPVIPIKLLLTSMFTAITLKLGVMADLLWLFIAAMTLDYITGVLSAAYNRQISSDTGYRGVIRKVGKLLVIAVALLTDEVVAMSAERFGATISTGGAIAAVVTIWLTLNELISILENISKMNVAMPEFLLRTIKMLKNQADSEGGKLVPQPGDDPQPEDTPDSADGE